MRLAKKILLTVLLLSAMISNYTVLALFSDIDIRDVTSNYIAIENLSQLKILEGYETGEFMPNKPLTRAEAAAVICRLLGHSIAFPAKTGFDDVSLEHWASGYISKAHELEIIDGVGENYFAPDELVTTKQMIKMIVCAVGFRPLAEVAEGYPDGFVTVAVQKNILDVPYGDTSDPISRSQTALAVFRSIDVKMLKKEFDDGSSAEYLVGEKTILNDVLLLNRFRGTIIGSGDNAVTIKDDSGLTKVFVTTIDYSNCLGCWAHYYTSSIDASILKTIVCLSEHSTLN